MSEERYLKITSCKECPHYGHAGTDSCGDTIFVCGYPKNMDIEQIPAAMIGKTLYPITNVMKNSKEILIPFWCKLPSKVT
jgi:hypothetical protein